jgi:hypothetical protein
MESSQIMNARVDGFKLHPGQRLLMLGFNCVPLVHGMTVAAIVGIAWAPLGWRLAAGLAVLYLAPALLARIVLLLSPISESRSQVGSRAFFTWWLLANLQMLFCRLPMLEEIIRMVPGLYSFWLRLWGARIGRLTYWGAGLRILDRSFLRIGDDVVFGAAVRLNAHVLNRNENGQTELYLASIVVGDRTMVGGYSLLTAGTEIAPDESTRAFLISPPFSRWKNGRRVKPTATT